MTVDVVDVTGHPAVAMEVMGTGGTRLHLTVYSGTCSVQRTSTSLFRSADPVQLGFYPDGCGGFPASHSITAHAELGLASLEVLMGGNGGRRRFGVADVQTQLVEHHNQLWPYVSFTALGGSSMQLSYRVTVHQPFH